MEHTKTPLLSVSDVIAVTNQTLDYALSGVAVEGEVSGFRVSQGKYVFFDLKDATGSIGCFMTVWQLRTPIEDGMKIIVTASPKVTDWGKFSLTVSAIRLSGEGSLKRSFELLEKKLEGEGLFRLERKRPLPEMPGRIAVISSTQAAGYADFIKIINDRWGGLMVDVAHVQVQGKEAPDQIVRALQFFNAREVMPDVIVIIRGGGSLDDLSVFNDEMLVRAVAGSRVPTLVGVGHEIDVTLADRAADVRAATPSNAAQLVVPDKRVIIERMHRELKRTAAGILSEVDDSRATLNLRLRAALGSMMRRHDTLERQLENRRRILAEMDPQKVLQRGYAIVRGAILTGQSVEIETSTIIATMEVQHVKNKA